jgi:hypothetical protein
MVFLLSILIFFISNTVDLQVYNNYENQSNYSEISVFSKNQVCSQATAIKTKLFKLGTTNKPEKSSKYRKRINNKRFSTLTDSSNSDLKNCYSNILQNQSNQIYIQNLDLHPNSLRAPPVFYCV